MAKSPNKPNKKAQLKATAVSTPKPKAAKKAAGLLVKKGAAAKVIAKTAKPIAVAKALKAKGKVAAARPVKKTAAKLVANPVAKKTVKAVKKIAAKPVSQKAVKQKAVNAKVVARSAAKVAKKPIGKKAAPVKAAPVKKVAPVKAAPIKKTAPVKKSAAKLPVKPAAVKASAPPISAKLIAVKQVTQKNKAGALAKPAVVAPPPASPKVGKAVHTSSKALTRTLAQLPPPPPPPPMLPPEPPRRTVSPAALKAFDQAVKVFNRQRYAEAKALFEGLEHKFPLDGELNGRAQVYIQACVKKLTHAPEPSRPVSADEFYDQGVHALNNGDFAQAKHYFEKALALNPNEPDFLYSLAATHAQTGAHDQALDFLRRSIQIKPRFRSQAFDDNDFLALRGNRQFQELLGLTSPFDRLEQRR